MSILRGEGVPPPARVPLRALVQWLHVMAVMTALGGTFFIGYLLLPAFYHLEAEDVQVLTGAIMPAFRIIVWLALGTFAITGVFMWLFRAYDAGLPLRQFLRTRYTALLVVKVVLAHGIAIPALLLTLPGFEAVKERMPTLMKLLPIIATIVIFIAAYLRRMRLPSERTSL